MKNNKRAPKVLGASLIFGLPALVLWSLYPIQAMDEARAALVSSESVRVQSEPWLVFQPTHGTPSTGMIFYPGAHIDPRGYAPAAQKIAENGYLVVIVPMPFNLAVFGVDKAREVMAAFPDIENWVIAGHSMGGAMAARFADNNPGRVAGIVLWASFPSLWENLSDQEIKTLSIYGTKDWVISPYLIRHSKSLLPQDTTWVPIEGGNHSQFGWYGTQVGDRPARISREEQQAQIVRATLDFLAKISTAP